MCQRKMPLSHALANERPLLCSAALSRPSEGTSEACGAPRTRDAPDRNKPPSGGGGPAGSVGRREPEEDAMAATTANNRSQSDTADNQKNTAAAPFSHNLEPNMSGEVKRQ